MGCVVGWLVVNVFKVIINLVVAISRGGKNPNDLNIINGE